MIKTEIEWFSPEEKLPEEGERVLCKLKIQHSINDQLNFYILKRFGNCWNAEYGICETGIIKYWCYLTEVK